MTWGLIVLGGVDAALLVTAVVIARHAEDFRVWEVLAVCVVAVLIHLVGLYVYKESLIRAGNADAVGRLSVLVTSLATGAPAAVVFAHIFISVVSSAASEVGLGKRTGDTTRPDFTAAREKAGRGDVDGAISEYRLCARAY
ncbi:MAG TPA: hypothetical protein HPP77_11900, partial [Candidatus Hydrogenedentes bacterium]|nr:hypothetical protein [Candidatus Hydrogenedentota bacterium]